MALVRRAAAPAPADNRATMFRFDASSGLPIWRRPNASERRQAARALSAMPDAVAVVCAHLAEEPNLSVRSIILTGLIVNKSPAVVDGLLPCSAAKTPTCATARSRRCSRCPMRWRLGWKPCLPMRTAMFAYSPSTWWRPCRTPWCRSGCASRDH